MGGLIPIVGLALYKRIYVTEIEVEDSSSAFIAQPLTLIDIKTEPLFSKPVTYSIQLKDLTYAPHSYSPWKTKQNKFFVDQMSMEAYDQSGKDVWTLIKNRSIGLEEDVEIFDEKIDYFKSFGIIGGVMGVVGLGGLALFHSEF